MSSETNELIQICEQLPEAQRAEVADFARFLLARNQDAVWERTIADAMAEGSEPLDPDKL